MWATRILLCLASAPRPGSPSSTRALFDFAANPSLALSFASMDDRVMGGSSVSRMIPQKDYASFVGELVLSGGGFASIRSTAGAWDLSGSDGIELAVRGDGPPYKFVVRIASAPRISYQQDFDAGDGTAAWRTCRLRWDEFVPTYLGRVVPNSPKIDLSAVTSVGFMLSKLTDVGQTNLKAVDGPFQLDVRTVTPFRAA
jgi:hypothetical protein